MSGRYRGTRLLLALLSRRALAGPELKDVCAAHGSGTQRGVSVPGALAKHRNSLGVRADFARVAVHPFHADVIVLDGAEISDLRREPVFKDRP